MALIKLLDIQRMSSEDGPGLRTTAFLKGCTLACAWCHNPESISARNQVVWHQNRCMGCMACGQVCPLRAVTPGPGGVSINRDICNGCYQCCDACPAGALEPKGKDITPEALCGELIKDKAYFGREGGVTLSGGEPLAQEASVDLLRLLKQAGISTAADTCGLLPAGRLEAALPFCGILLFDVKIADSGRHKTFTGSGNERILENLKTAGEWAAQGGRLWIRTPVIPGATDSVENIVAIADILSRVPCVERWELCAFNNLCASKYQSMNVEWKYAGIDLVTEEDMQDLLQRAEAAGAVSDIRATGARRRTETGA